MSNRDLPPLLAQISTTESSESASRGVDRFRGMQFAGVSRRQALRARRDFHAASFRRRHTLAAHPRHSILHPVATRVEVEGLQPSPDELAFLHHVFRLANLPLARYRISPLTRRLPACLRAIKASTLADATHRTAADLETLGKAVDALVIGVTSFFRDPQVFAHLRQEVIPELARRETPPRVWSAACSDGAELYSVAMLLAEHQVAASALLGTDCRPAAIEQARRGRYSKHQLSTLDPALRDRFFTAEAGATSMQINASLRDQTKWRVADLTDVPTDPAAAASSAQWDLILCRNMAIYLQDVATARLWTTLSASLRPGGFLIVGKAERPSVSGLCRTGPCTYRKS